MTLTLDQVDFYLTKRDEEMHLTPSGIALFVPRDDDGMAYNPEHNISMLKTVNAADVADGLLGNRIGTNAYVHKGTSLDENRFALTLTMGRVSLRMHSRQFYPIANTKLTRLLPKLKGGREDK